MLKMKEDGSSPCRLILFQKPFFPGFRRNPENRPKLEFRNWQLEVQGHEEVLSKWVNVIEYQLAKIFIWIFRSY